MLSTSRTERQSAARRSQQPSLWHSEKLPSRQTTDCQPVKTADSNMATTKCQVARTPKPKE
eukprot:1897083-Prorocentrum_lima.AAC.1